MKRIVILRCLRSNNVCTGAACMRAFNTKSGAFARYGEEPLELEAYWSCNAAVTVTLNTKRVSKKSWNVLSA